jgi:hypothetical protein
MSSPSHLCGHIPLARLPSSFGADAKNSGHAFMDSGSDLMRKGFANVLCLESLTYATRLVIFHLTLVGSLNSASPPRHWPGASTL